MTVKVVTIRLTGEDADLRRMLDELERRKRELAGTIRFGGDATQPTRDLDRLRMQLDELNRRTIRLKVDSKEGKLQVKELKQELLDLNRQVSSPRISLQDFNRTILQIEEVKHKLNELNRSEHVRILGNNNGGFLSRLRGGGGAGGGGGNSGVKIPLGPLGGIPIANPGAFAGIGALVELLGSLVPALGGLGTGLGVGGLGIFAGLKMNPRDMKGFKNDLHQIMAPIGQDTRPLITGLFQAMGPLAQMVKSLGPQLTQMFKGAIPFVKMFVDFMGKAGKSLIPAFTQTMKEMVPYLPIMEKGLLQIVKGIGNFLKDLGPGMKDSAVIFLAVGKTINGLLIGLAALFNFFAHQIRITGTIFNAVWHGAVAVWKWFSHIVEVGTKDVGQFLTGLWKSTVHIFDNIKTGVEAAWSTLWDTIKRIVSDAVGWITSALGPIFSAISAITSFFGGGGGGNGGYNLHAPGLPGGRSIGGWIPGQGSPNVDSRIIAVAPGERVLSHTEIMGFGGPRAVDDAFGNSRTKGGAFGFAHGGYIERPPHNIAHRVRRFRDEIMNAPHGINAMRWDHVRGPVVEIHFHGVVTDPKGTAREIRRVLIDYKRDQLGGRALGLA